MESRSMPDEYFRAGVGAVILSPGGQVLVLERSDIPGAWQLPQGGLDGGEEPEQAVYREVSEETGLRPEHLTTERRLPELMAYELPPEARTPRTGRGQVQYWFYLRLTAPEHAPNLAPGGEFQSWRWVEFDELIQISVSFRRPIYERLKDYYKAEIAGTNALG